MRIRIWPWLMMFVLLSGCGGGGAISVTLLPTLTPRPTVTATWPASPEPPTPTASPTATPAPTATPLPGSTSRASDAAASHWQVAGLTAVDGRATWALLADTTSDAWRLMTGDVAQPFQRDITPEQVCQTRQLPVWLPVDAQRILLYLGGATVVSTQDGGRTWRVELLPMPPEAEGLMPDWGLWAYDASTGRAALLVSLEGGMQHDYAALFVREPSGSWRLAFSPYEQPDSPLNLFASTGLAMYGQTLWVTKDNGVTAGAIWVASHDLGRTWQSQVQQTEATGDAPCPTFGPHLWSATQGLVAATCLDWATGQMHPHLLHVTKAQVRWQPLPEGASNIHFWDAARGYAWRPSGDAGITAQLWLTDDGGLSWQTRPLPPDADEVTLTRDGVGFAWPALEPDGLGVYWVTTDGWRSYQTRAVTVPTR